MGVKLGSVQKVLLKQVFFVVFFFVSKLTVVVTQERRLVGFY